MAKRNFGVHSRSRSPPIASRFLVCETVVPKRHHIVDPCCPISIVIVIRLPDGTERVDTHLPVVAEIPSQRFELATVHVAPKDHALVVGFDLVSDFVTRHVNNLFSVFVFDLLSGVPKVEVKFAVRAKHKRVDAVVVLGATDTSKENFLFVGFEIAIGIDQDKYGIVGGDDRSIAQHANAMSRINVTALVESRFFVGNRVAIGVFDDQNPITGFAWFGVCLLYTSPSPRERTRSRMPSSA